MKLTEKGYIDANGRPIRSTWDEQIHKIMASPTWKTIEPILQAAFEAGKKSERSYVRVRTALGADPYGEDMGR